MIIKSDQVKHLSIPHFQGLAVKDMLLYARNYNEVMNSLPIDKEIHKLTRQYVANVIYTIKGDHFSQWVDQRIKEGNDKIKA